MAIDALPVWQSTMAALPKVADTSWAMNFANWVGDRVVNISTDSSKLNTSAGFVFVFNRAVFAAQLLALTPTGSALSGIQGFANAWETAILTTVFPSTLNVSSGAFIGVPAPPTTFSVVSSVVLDPSGIAAGKAKIMELVTAPPVANAMDSQFPIKFREAFLALTITVSGLDTTPTPAGPLPLTAATVPLV